MNEYNNPLTRGQAVYMIFVCLLAIIFSVYVLLIAEPVEKVKWEPKITKPSVVTVTPLDSPNPCWDPEFWSKID